MDRGMDCHRAAVNTVGADAWLDTETHYMYVAYALRNMQHEYEI